MEKALETEILKDMYASMSPERREEIKNRASALTKDKDFIKAAELLKNSPSIEMDEAKFAGGLGWLAALSVAIAAAATLT